MWTNTQQTHTARTINTTKQKHNAKVQFSVSGTKGGHCYHRAEVTSHTTRKQQDSLHREKKTRRKENEKSSRFHGYTWSWFKALPNTSHCFDLCNGIYKKKLDFILCNATAMNTIGILCGCFDVTFIEIEWIERSKIKSGLEWNFGSIFSELEILGIL